MALVPGNPASCTTSSQVEFFDEGSEEEDPCRIGVKGSLRDIDKGNL